MTREEEYLKKHFGWTDRDLEYRPIVKYWEVLKLMESYKNHYVKAISDDEIGKQIHGIGESNDYKQGFTKGVKWREEQLLKE